MDIRNIGHTGNVERGTDRPKRTEAARDYVIPTVQRDEASISSSTRETAAAVEGLTTRARQSDGDRAAKIAAAQQKLRNGELDTPAVHAETGKQLLAAKFFSV